MTIAIVGVGYVGLPLAIAFAKKKSVLCYDINKVRVQSLQKGIDLNKQHFKKEISHKNLIFTSNENLLQNHLFYIITVPTPIDRSNSPDLHMLKQATLLVGKYIKKNSIIIFESTTYPGCTEEFCIPLLEQASELEYKKDFYVAYSPERVNPGDKINILQNITKIVGSNDKNTLHTVEKLYKMICKSIYPVLSIKVAESAKVIENVQRDLNIALVNELSVLFHKINIPTNEVLKAAATKWNFHYYKPGLVGGHCISVDPYYLAYKAAQKNYFPQIILSGRNFNENMGKYVAKQTMKLLSKNKTNVAKASVAVLGFSFKDNISDIRNTKVIQIIKELQNRNIKVRVFDSIVRKSEVKKEYKIHIYRFKDLKKFKYDAIVLAVSHDMFLKKLEYYNQFYKNKNNKIFIDIKNNYLTSDLKEKKFKFFQL